MPEGDTIRRAARRLHAALAGKAVVAFETAFAQIARAVEGAPIVRRTVEGVSARVKHCLVRLSGDLVLRTHCRMHGSRHLYRPGKRWQRAAHRMRVRIDVPDFVAVTFDMPVAELRTGRELSRDPAIARRGPDLLAERFDPAEAVARARDRGDEAIGIVLLRQDVAAGAPGEVVFSGGLRRTTGFLHPEARLWAYGRGGEPCRRCAGPIAAAKQGEDARVVFWCPRCQPEAHAPAAR